MKGLVLSNLESTSRRQYCELDSSAESNSQDQVTKLYRAGYSHLKNAIECKEEYRTGSESRGRKIEVKVNNFKEYIRS